jgi:hypothetical protein
MNHAPFVGPGTAGLDTVVVNAARNSEILVTDGGRTYTGARSKGRPAAAYSRTSPRDIMLDA